MVLLKRRLIYLEENNNFFMGGEIKDIKKRKSLKAEADLDKDYHKAQKQRFKAPDNQELCFRLVRVGI